jgi:hypothetical protein
LKKRFYQEKQGENFFSEKDGRKRPSSLPRRFDTAVSDKPKTANIVFPLHPFSKN